MSEIDPGIRAIAFIAFLASLVGPVVWLVIRKGFVIIAGIFLSVQVSVAAASAYWSEKNNLAEGYQGLPATFENFLFYHLSSFGTVFVGLSLVALVLTRFRQ